MCSVKKIFLEISQIHKKAPVPESFFNKVAGLRPTTLLKKRLWHRCFPVNFAKFLKILFLKEHLWWRAIIQKLKSVFKKFVSYPRNKMETYADVSKMLKYWKWWLTFLVKEWGNLFIKLPRFNLSVANWR